MYRELNACELAKRLHGTQTDKQGFPYFTHLTRVAANLKRLFPDFTEVEAEAAWLHDVLEDCETTAAELRSLGIGREAVEIVKEVTRHKSWGYLDWIKRIAESGSISAVRVKYADNLDNSDPTRAIPSMEARYAKAREFLEARLFPKETLEIYKLEET